MDFIRNFHSQDMENGKLKSYDFYWIDKQLLGKFYPTTLNCTIVCLKVF